MFFAAVAAAAVVLNEILYDPAGVDGGREFVELFNATEAPLPLAGLELELGDGAHPGVWRLAWRGTSGELAVATPFVIGGDSVHAAARLLVDLQNGPDALRLRRGAEVLDRVGWGALAVAELFETRPCADVTGASLARQPDGRDTDDNGADFVAAVPSPGRFNQPRRNASLRLAPPDPTTMWPGRALVAGATVRNAGLEVLPQGTWSVVARLQWAAAPEMPPWPLVVRGNAGDLAPGDSLHFDVEWVGEAGLFRLEAAILPADHDSTDDRGIAVVRVGAGPVVVNEIQFAPVDDAPEWIELWNRDAMSHDLAGWTLADASGRRARLVPAARLPPGAFAIIAPDSQIAIAGLAAPALRLAAVPWNTLNNSDGDDGFADRLVLRDAAGSVVDALRYAAAGTERGRSLERLVADPDARGVLWAACKDASGSTPGRANSAPAPPLPAAQLALAPNPFTPDGDGQDDVLTARLEVPLGCQGFRARVFDLEGRCRVRLAADRLGPGPRQLVWDGRDDSRSDLPSGFYILNLEFDSKSGPPQRLRRVVGLSRP